MPSTVALLIRHNCRYQTISRRQPQQYGPGDVYVIRWYEERRTKTRYRNVGTNLNEAARLRMQKEMTLSQPQEPKVPEKQALTLKEAIQQYRATPSDPRYLDLEKRIGLP